MGGDNTFSYFNFIKGYTRSLDHYGKTEKALQIIKNNIFTFNGFTEKDGEYVYEGVNQGIIENLVSSIKTTELVKNYLDILKNNKKQSAVFSDSELDMLEDASDKNAQRSIKMEYAFALNALNQINNEYSENYDEYGWKLIIPVLKNWFYNPEETAQLFEDFYTRLLAGENGESVLLDMFGEEDIKWFEYNAVGKTFLKEIVPRISTERMKEYSNYLITSLKMANVFCDLRQYRNENGELPESLAQLKNDYSELDLYYSKAEGVLYSKQEDGEIETEIILDFDEAYQDTDLSNLIEILDDKMHEDNEIIYVNFCAYLNFNKSGLSNFIDQIYNNEVVLEEINFEDCEGYFYQPFVDKYSEEISFSIFYRTKYPAKVNYDCSKISEYGDSAEYSAENIEQEKNWCHVIEFHSY